MEEIKVGEYVRIDKDFRTICLGIGKAVNKNKDTIYVKMSNNDLPISFNINNVTKHDEDIKNLIEAGDYVNGYKVSDKESTLLITNVKGIDRSSYHIPISQYGDGIKSIVTKEQFASMEYKLEG